MRVGEQDLRPVHREFSAAIQKCAALGSLRMLAMVREAREMGRLSTLDVNTERALDRAHPDRVRRRHKQRLY